LKPGIGHLEQVEIDLEPRCDDGPVPTRLKEWYEWLADSTYRGGKPLQYPSTAPDILRQQGFVDIKETVIRLPVNPWPADLHGRAMGRWYNLGLCEGLEAISLGPLTRVYGWPAEDVRRLVGEVKGLICDKRNHVYNNLQVSLSLPPSLPPSLLIIVFKLVLFS
jgi:hypothetical protein